MIQGKNIGTDHSDYSHAAGDDCLHGLLQTFFPPGRRRLRVALAICGTAAAIVLLLLLRAIPPGEGSPWPGCIFHKLTGLYCPACGNTRALHALLHFDIPACFSRNALFLPSLALLAGVLLSNRIRHSAAIGYIAATIYVIFTISRNLPWYPFNLLAP